MGLKWYYCLVKNVNSILVGNVFLSTNVRLKKKTQTRPPPLKTTNKTKQELPTKKLKGSAAYLGILSLQKRKVVLQDLKKTPNITNQEKETKLQK